MTGVARFFHDGRGRAFCLRCFEHFDESDVTPTDVIVEHSKCLIIVPNDKWDAFTTLIHAALGAEPPELDQRMTARTVPDGFVAAKFWEIDGKG